MIKTKYHNRTQKIIKTLLNRPFLALILTTLFLYLILSYDHENLDTAVLGYNQSSREISFCYRNYS